MNPLEGAFRRKLYYLVGLGSCILFLVTWGLVKGLLTPGELGFAAAIWWALMVTGMAVLVMSFWRSAEERRAFRTSPVESGNVHSSEMRLRRIRNLKRWIVFMILAFVYGLWAMRNKPMLTQIERAAANLCITGLLIYTVLRLRKSEKQQRLNG